MASSSFISQHQRCAANHVFDTATQKIYLKSIHRRKSRLIRSCANETRKAKAADPLQITTCNNSKVGWCFFDHESVLDIETDIIWSTSNQLISDARGMRDPLEQKAWQVCVSAVLSQQHQDTQSARGEVICWSLPWLMGVHG